MTGHALRAVFVALAACLIPAGEATAQARPDWTGVGTDLGAMAGLLQGASRPDGRPAGTARLPVDAAGELQMRPFCGLPLAIFSDLLVQEDCDGPGACTVRRRTLAERAAALSRESPANAARAVSDGLLFVPADADFERGPPTEAEQLPYRAAADLWLRNWSNEAFGAGAPGKDDYLMLMKAWCGLADRNSVEALSWIARNGFPSDADALGRRQVASLVYVAEHIATQPSTVARFRSAAEVRFAEGGLSPFYMVQFLDTERTAYDGRQAVGSFTSCREGRGVFDPPLVDEPTSNAIRLSYGLSSNSEFLASASRRCEREAQQ